MSVSNHIDSPNVRVFRVSTAEIVDEAASFQAIERILLAKGAPIKGFFWLEPDMKNYVWRRWTDTDGNQCFEVELKEI